MGMIFLERKLKRIEVVRIFFPFSHFRLLQSGRPTNINARKDKKVRVREGERERRGECECEREREKVIARLREWERVCE